MKIEGKKVSEMRVWKSISMKIFCVFIIVLSITFFIILQISNEYIYDTVVEQRRVSDNQIIGTIGHAINSEVEKFYAYGHAIQNDETVIAYMMDTVIEEGESKAAYLEEDSRVVTQNYSDYYDVGAITLIDKQGYIIGEQVLERQSVYNFLGQTAMKSISKDEPQILKMYRLRYLEDGRIENVIPVTIPLNRGGELLGYAIFYIQEETISDIFKQYNGAALLLNQENQIISAEDKGILYDNYYRDFGINYAYLLENTTTTTLVNEVEYIITTQIVNELGWQIVMQKNAEDAIQELQSASTFNQSLFIIVFVVVATIILVSSFFIGRPISKLNRTMKKVKQGDLTVRNANSAQDEIGELSATFNEMLDSINNLMITTKKNEEDKHKAQIELIQSQIRPHFLYNILGIISGFIANDEKRLGSLAIDSLASFYRIFLSDGNDNIPLYREVELVENYLTLQQIRFVDRIDYEIDIDDILSNSYIPKLTLQLLVENAIHHGIMNKESGFIQIKGWLEDNTCVLTIKDDGVGMKRENVDELNQAIIEGTQDCHFGVVSIKKRLDYLYETETRMIFESVCEEYSKVRLEFPYYKGE